MLGSGVVGGTPYLAMEMIEGQSLTSWLPASGTALRDPGRTRNLLRFAAQLARALDHAHSKGVVHRDVQPANVLIRASGEAVLIDFGFALMKDGRDVALPGERIGSLNHIAPEVWAGADAGPAADVFGLCAIVSLALTGHPPFPPATRAKLVKQRKNEGPARAVLACKHLEPDVRAVLARGLAWRPQDRHANAAALGLELDALVDRTTSPAVRATDIPGTARRLHRFLRRWFAVLLSG